MSRSDTERIADMLEAISAIESSTRFLEGTTDTAAAEIFVDAITYRLLTIGEAVKGLSDDFRLRHPSVPWRDISGMRDVIAHEYQRRDITVIWATVGAPLASLTKALELEARSNSRD
jgi:uncharacterized protein with HEPN domain